MKAYAMNGAGNAFIVIDAREHGGPLALSPARVAALHERHPFDQIMGLESHGVADAHLRVWNADGGEVGACGNGTRAAAWLMFQDDNRSRRTLAAQGGALGARRLDTGLVEVDLGQPGLGWRDIPLAREMDTMKLDFGIDLPGGGRLEGPGAVSMGNPHAVFFVEDVAALPLAEIGPRIEHDPLFPERVNAGFAQVIDRQTIRLRVWERGAGLTLACGTGACAALVAAHRRGLTEREAVIIADGGELPVRWDADGHVHLSGPVEMEGELDIEGLV
ncbi:diaminopimelate epimerase [Glycocaulis sp.]|uniref:diaminopimelate epimerase n=1 Tax=Glycocaulis sp. TaxID=1969725 RepID=UPI003D1A476E